MVNNDSTQYREAYEQGRPLVPDYVYDSMFDSNEAELDSNAGQGELIDHAHFMGSLPTYFMDIDNLSEQAIADTCHVNIEDKVYTVSYKLDGVPGSCILTANGWNKIVSRGKRFKGFVVSNKLIAKLPTPLQMPTGDTEIDFRGEFVIAKSDFEKLNNELPENERYANPRSMVSSAINSLNPDQRILDILQWFAHGIWIGNEPSDHFAELKQWLPENAICKHTRCVKDNVIDALKQFYANAMVSNIPCDGVVLQHTCTTANDGRCNLDRIAIKQFDEAKFSATTVLDSIEWRLTNNGSYIPRLCFKPVTINGSEITHAAGYNLDYVRRLGLSIGAEVTVTMRGGVIPYVSSVQHIGNGDYMFPADAIEPEDADIHLWSSNSETAVQRIKFIRGMEMLDLKDCGVTIFNDMFEHGFTSIFEVAKSIKDGSFYNRMKVFMPNTSATEVKLHCIKERFDTFNYVWLILALREHGIGFKAANAIGQSLSGYTLRNPRQLDKKAIQAFLAKHDIIKLIKEYSNPVLPEHADLSIIANAPTVTSNKPKVCMSKKPSNGMKKAEFAKTFLQDYDITDNIREAQLLICPAGEMSNKIRYAEANNIEIKHYEDFVQ
jgi:NAD-dependent DNA ligase